MADLAHREQATERDQQHRSRDLVEELRAKVERLAAAGVERYASWREESPEGPSPQPQQDGPQQDGSQPDRAEARPADGRPADGRPDDEG